MNPWTLGIIIAGLGLAVLYIDRSAVARSEAGRVLEAVRHKERVAVAMAEANAESSIAIENLEGEFEKVSEELEKEKSRAPVVQVEHVEVAGACSLDMSLRELRSQDAP